MFDLFLDAYVRFFAVLLPGLVVVIIGLNALKAGLAPARAMTVAAGLAVLFGVWFALASAMAHAGLLMPPPTLASPPFVMMLLLGGAGLLWALARLTPLGRTITDATDQSFLIGFQIPRIMGAVFLVGWAVGAIPWEFALPAGLGDIWAGVAGYKAMQAVRNGDPQADRKVLRANVIGLADFAVAVFMGLMTSEGFLHLLSRDTPNIINAYPLALFPGFFVALFLAAHFVSLSRLARTRAVAQPT